MTTTTAKFKQTNSQTLTTGDSSPILQRNSTDQALTIPNLIGRKAALNQSTESLNSDTQSPAMEVCNFFIPQFDYFKTAYPSLNKRFIRGRNKIHPSDQKMLLETEKRTYSFKYFGVTGDQLGVFSLRTSLNQPKRSSSTQSIRKKNENVEQYLPKTASPEVKKILLEIDRDFDNKYNSTTQNKNSRGLLRPVIAGKRTGTKQVPEDQKMKVNYKKIVVDDIKNRGLLPNPDRSEHHITNNHLPLNNLPLHMRCDQLKRSSSAGNMRFVNGGFEPGDEQAKRVRTMAGMTAQSENRRLPPSRQGYTRSMSRAKPGPQFLDENFVRTSKFLPYDVKQMMTDRNYFSYRDLLNGIQIPTAVENRPRQTGRRQKYLHQRMGSTDYGKSMHNSTMTSTFFKTTGHFVEVHGKPEQNPLFKTFLNVKSKIETEHTIKN